MKSIITVLSAITIIITISCTASLPLVYDKENPKPLELWVESQPDIIGSAEVVLLNYDWNGKKAEFEAMQNANGEIVYKISSGKFAGLHDYSPEFKYELKEKGEISFHFSSKVVNGYLTGKGTVSMYVDCTYRDKDGNKHSGIIGRVKLNVTFKRP